MAGMLGIWPFFYFFPRLETLKKKKNPESKTIQNSPTY